MEAPYRRHRGPALGDGPGAALKRAVEAASLRAWPALEEFDLDGWVLRYAEGFTGRANSVQSLIPGATPLEERVESCEAWYAERSRPTLFRLTPFSEPGLDEALAQRGYERSNRTLVLHRSTSGLAPDFPALEVEHAELSDWLRRYAQFTGLPAAPAPMRRIIERSSDRAMTGVLWTERPRRAVACGLAVTDGSLVGLFDVVVDPQERRKGWGSELVRHLVAWGLRADAERAYLQVTADNVAALTLYDSLGFQVLYEYWYRNRGA